MNMNNGAVRKVWPRGPGDDQPTPIFRRKSTNMLMFIPMMAILASPFLLLTIPLVWLFNR